MFGLKSPPFRNMEISGFQDKKLAENKYLKHAEKTYAHIITLNLPQLLIVQSENMMQFLQKSVTGVKNYKCI